MCLKWLLTSYIGYVDSSSNSPCNIPLLKKWACFSLPALAEFTRRDASACRKTSCSITTSWKASICQCIGIPKGGPAVGQGTLELHVMHWPPDSFWGTAPATYMNGKRWNIDNYRCAQVTTLYCLPHSLRNRSHGTYNKTYLIAVRGRGVGDPSRAIHQTLWNLFHRPWSTMLYILRLF